MTAKEDLALLTGASLVAGIAALQFPAVVEVVRLIASYAELSFGLFFFGGTLSLVCGGAAGSFVEDVTSRKVRGVRGFLWGVGVGGAISLLISALFEASAANALAPGSIGSSFAALAAVASGFAILPSVIRGAYVRLFAPHRSFSASHHRWLQELSTLAEELRSARGEIELLQVRVNERGARLAILKEVSATTDSLGELTPSAAHAKDAIVEERSAIQLARDRIEQLQAKVERVVADIRLRTVVRAPGEEIESRITTQRLRNETSRETIEHDRLLTRANDELEHDLNG